MAIPFVQFMRPDGKQLKRLIDRPKEIEREALQLIVWGFRFTLESLPGGNVMIDCEDPRDIDTPLYSEVVENGPQVPYAVDRVVTRAYLLASATYRPSAVPGLPHAQS